jgi:hypothetical protein
VRCASDQAKGLNLSLHRSLVASRRANNGARSHTLCVACRWTGPGISRASSKVHIDTRHDEREVLSAHSKLWTLASTLRACAWCEWGWLANLLVSKLSSGSNDVVKILICALPPYWVKPQILEWISARVALLLLGEWVVEGKQLNPLRIPVTAAPISSQHTAPRTDPNCYI